MEAGPGGPPRPGGIRAAGLRAIRPYWQRHNRWTGETRNRWIYNDIIRRFWLPPGRNPDFPNGAWIDSSYQVYTSSWPPDIGADPEGGNTG